MEQYEKVRVLGSGSFGAAWLVRKKSSFGELVIKEISLNAMALKDQEQALNEVKILARFRHKNIIRYKDAFIFGSNLEIVMEYADGGDLSSRISTQNGELFQEKILIAIKYIHSQNILHRDLKAANVFLTKGGWVKIGDFGIAKLLEDGLDKARTLVGTPYYLSPELCKLLPYDYKSDMWSAGVVLYELLTLKQPFVAEDFTSLIKLIMKGKYQPISRLYGPLLQDLVLVLLETNPEKRPSAAQLLRVPSMQSHVQDYIGRAKADHKKQKPEPKDQSFRNICEIMRSPVHAPTVDSCDKSSDLTPNSGQKFHGNIWKRSAKSLKLGRGPRVDLIEEVKTSRGSPSRLQLSGEHRQDILSRPTLNANGVSAALTRSVSCESGIHNLIGKNQSNKVFEKVGELTRENLVPAVQVMHSTVSLVDSKNPSIVMGKCELPVEEANAKYTFVRKRPSNMKKTVVLKKKAFDLLDAHCRKVAGPAAEIRKCDLEGASKFACSPATCDGVVRNAQVQRKSCELLSEPLVKPFDQARDHIEENPQVKPTSIIDSDCCRRSRSRSVLASCSEHLKARIASRVRAAKLKRESQNVFDNNAPVVQNNEDDSVFVLPQDHIHVEAERQSLPYFEESTDFPPNRANQENRIEPLHSTLNDHIIPTIFNIPASHKVCSEVKEQKKQFGKANWLSKLIEAKCGDRSIACAYAALKNLCLSRDTLEGLVKAGDLLKDSPSSLPELLKLMLFEACENQSEFF